MATRHLSPSHLRRYRLITRVIIRHGLGFFVNVLGLGRFAPFRLGNVIFRRRREPGSQPETIRKCLEDMGTTFVKLGQILSTRSDLIPPEYQEELAKLQDDVKAVPSETITDLVVSEIGRPIDQVFSSFDLEPLAAASIGQVHLATLIDGTEVVVKVRRPGVVEQVEIDLDVLHHIANSASRFSRFSDRYDLIEVVEEFSNTLMEELDYRNEARNAERIAKNFAEDQSIHIPRIFWEATTSGMITMSRITGIKVTDSEGLDAAGVDRQALANRSANIILKMIFEDGLFHGDPHPGNFFIEGNGRIGLIDYGQVGILDDRTRDRLIDLVLAARNQDSHRVVDALQDLGMGKDIHDLDAFRKDLVRLGYRYYGQSLGDIQVGAALNEALDLARRHRLKFPTTLANLIKVLLMAEGIGRHLDPEFNIAAVIKPYGNKMVELRYSPIRRQEKYTQAVLDTVWLATELPHIVHRVLADVEAGGLRVRLEQTASDRMFRRFQSMANRVILGIIAAASINALAVLLTISGQSELERWAGIAFIVGLAAVAFTGILLVWGLFHPGQD